MSLSQTCVAKLYASVIDDVINGVREYFMDDGVDEQVLMELKQSWENRLKTTRAVEPNNPEPEPQPPSINNHRSGGSGMIPIPPDYNSNTVSVHVTLPVIPNSPPRVLTIQVPQSASLDVEKLQAIMSGPVIQATLALPDDLAAQMLQTHVNSALKGQTARISGIGLMTSTGGLPNGGSSDLAGGSVPQVDGVRDSSDDDDENDDEDDNEEEEEGKEEEEEEEGDNGGVEEEPLNSDDDVSEEDPSGLFETYNVVVCQYDKISRSRNKWKFYLKDGIMNLGGKDYVFQKSNGDAEW